MALVQLKNGFDCALDIVGGPRSYIGAERNLVDQDVVGVACKNVLEADLWRGIFQTKVDGHDIDRGVAGQVDGPQNALRRS